MIFKLVLKVTFSLFFAGKHCVFPFKFLEWTAYGCLQFEEGGNKVTTLFSTHNIYDRNIQPLCATEIDEYGFGKMWSVGYCSPDCPIHPNAFTTDETLKVTHHNLDQKEMMIAVKLLGIMSSSLLLIGLMVVGLGMSRL